MYKRYVKYQHVVSQSLIKNQLDAKKVKERITMTGLGRFTEFFLGTLKKNQTMDDTTSSYD